MAYLKGVFNILKTVRKRKSLSAFMRLYQNEKQITWTQDK